MRYLTIAAHPDDEVLGCGATMARLASEGHGVHIVILGEGATSRGENPDDASSEVVALRRQANKASELLGATSVAVESFPDNRFDQIALLDIVKVIESYIDDLKPDVVFTHHGSDLNIDHRLTAQAVVTATRTIAGTPVKEVLAFHIPSSTEWAFGVTGDSFQPDVFFDVGDHVSTKISAMEIYDAEARPFPHPRSPEALDAISKMWGSTAGFGAAEAFELVRSLR
jgi:LmbE family N-acetylglucosaminyl deacetylase